MLVLKRSEARWWRKPLAIVEGRLLPAELAVLRRHIREGEAGAWLNSRGVASGVTDLEGRGDGRFKSQRCSLPPFVSDILRQLYCETGLRRGAPDLVLWNEAALRVRFIEVKCPHWDRQSAEQRLFAEAATAKGLATEVVEWEFA